MDQLSSMVADITGHIETIKHNHNIILSSVQNQGIDRVAARVVEWVGVRESVCVCVCVCGREEGRNGG